VLLKRIELSLLICLFGASALAQEFRATLQGGIADPSQAAVPKAAVTLKNLETGIQHETTSDAAGHYVFTFVPPGSYTLTVKAAGFKTTIREGILLSIHDNL